MRFNSNWNRRGFLGTAAAVAASIFAPRKLFSVARAAASANADVSGLDKLRILMMSLV